MNEHYRVALLGFSDFERRTLASYFRLASARQPRYDQVQMLTDADFLVADADHAPSVQLVIATERVAETVFIGSQAPPGALAWMTRPIDALHVMRELDAMVTVSGLPPRPGDAAVATTLAQAPQRARSVDAVDTAWPRLESADGGETSISLLWSRDGDDELPAAAAAPEPLPPEADEAAEIALLPEPLPLLPAELPAVAPRARRRPPELPLADALPAARGAASVAAPRAAPSSAAPVSPSPALAAPPTAPRALLVDDSEIALRFLETRLHRHGLASDRAVTSRQALELLQSRPYELVFLDVELGAESELDGLALCQHIKRSPAGVTAAVVLVSAHHSELDRVRGALAGCDGYLGKPLDVSELERLLQRYGVATRPRARAPRPHVDRR